MLSKTTLLDEEEDEQQHLADKEEDENFRVTERYLARITAGTTSGASSTTTNNSTLHVAAAIQQFVTLMPKGGDIHHHFSGAIYAETYLDWVQEDGHFIHSTTFQIHTLPTPETVNVSGVGRVCIWNVVE